MDLCTYFSCSICFNFTTTSLSHLGPFLRVGRFWILCWRAHLQSCLSCTPTKDTQKQSHVETISQIFLCILWLRYYKKSKPVHLLQFLCNSIIVYLCVIWYYTFWASFSTIQLVTLSRSLLNNKVVTIIILSQQLKLVWSRNSSNHWLDGDGF